MAMVVLLNDDWWLTHNSQMMTACPDVDPNKKGVVTGSGQKVAGVFADASSHLVGVKALRTRVRHLRIPKSPFGLGGFDP